MYVLGIETATDVCSVGLVDGERDLASFSLLRPRQHGTRLAGLISAAMEASGVAPEALDGIAVSSGPGSYTGLRIGVSTAKGLGLASGAALLAVPTLQALAHASGAAETVVAVLPSRRGEVYAAAYRSRESTWDTVLTPEALALAEFAEWVRPLGTPTLVGSGAGAASGALREAAIAHHTRDATPSGLVIARLGRQRLLAGETEDLAAYEPAYLKPFVSGDPAARARG